MRKSLVLSLAGLALSVVAQPSWAADDLTITVVGPMTGPVATVGEQQKRGAEAAAALINEAGGVNGRKVKIAIEDDVCDP